MNHGLLKNPGVIPGQFQRQVPLLLFHKLGLKCGIRFATKPTSNTLTSYKIFQLSVSEPTLVMNKLVANGCAPDLTMLLFESKNTVSRASMTL